MAQGAGERNRGWPKPGEVRNPKGRPLSSKHRLSEDFLADLHADWKRYGVRALSRCRNKRPDVYLKVVASLIPKDQHLQVDIIQRLAALPPAQLDAMRNQVQQRIAALEGRDVTPARR